jgi:Trk K+ transport system NAD-binding subunit
MRPTPAIIMGMAFLFLLVIGSHGSVGWTNITIFASLIAFLVKFGVALWVYLRNPSAKVNRYFAIVFAGQAVWDLGKFFMWMSASEGAAFIWSRISYSGYIISVFFLLGFVWAYTKRKNFFTSVPGRFVLYVPMILLLILLWSGGSVISHLIPPGNLSYGYGIELWDYEYGPVYNYFFMWFQIIPFLYAFMAFVVKYFHVTTADKKKQLLYLMIGSAFPIAIGIPTGVILPSMGINLPPHNNVLSLIMSIFIAIGIIKYKFLAIQPVGESIVAGRKLEHDLAREYIFDFRKAYFIKHEESCGIAHKVLLTHLYNGRYGLILTAHNPSNIRHEYGIETTPIVWITDTETEHLSVEPIDIEQMYNTVKSFVGKVKNSFVLIDGLDYLLKHNSFAKILHFVKQVKVVVEENDGCLIIPAGSLVLDPKSENLLLSQFTVLPKARASAAAKERKGNAAGKVNYVIIGHTPLAQSIMHEFEIKRIRPTLVEKHDVLVHYLKGAVNLVKGDPLSGKVLEHAGIAKPNTIVLITLENDSDIILCINKIRQLSDSAKIISNIHNDNFIQIAVKAGADKVVPSSSIGGRLISLALSSPDVVRWVMDATTLTNKNLELIELPVYKTRFSGKTICEVDALMHRAANVVAVNTIDGLKQIPDDNYVLKEEDSLVMIANLNNLPKGKSLAERINMMSKRH